MSDHLIRHAFEDDAPALTTCLSRAYAPFAARLPDLPPMTEGVEEDLATLKVWVAEDLSGVCGCVFLMADREGAQLVNLAVDPRAQGRGLGRHLIATAENGAREAGARSIRLATHVGMPQNLSLYSGLGWTETGREGNKVYFEKSL